jgi:sugar lactone lactonase YvrE
MDELFITTASVGLTEEERRQQPLAGSVFHIKVGVRGRPTYRFAG